GCGLRADARRPRRGGGRLRAAGALRTDREPALHRLVRRRDRLADRRRPALRRDPELSNGRADLGRQQRAGLSRRARAPAPGRLAARRPAPRAMICYDAPQHLTGEDDMSRALAASLAAFAALT